MDGSINSRIIVNASFDALMASWRHRCHRGPLKFQVSDVSSSLFIFRLVYCWAFLYSDLFSSGFSIVCSSSSENFLPSFYCSVCKALLLNGKKWHLRNLQQNMWNILTILQHSETNTHQKNFRFDTFIRHRKEMIWWKFQGKLWKI